jgi:hypothetical protein
MNDWTLIISDPEIRHAFDLVRYERFSTLLKPAIVITLLGWSVAVLQDETSDEEHIMKHAFYAIPEWVTLIIWGILNCFSKKHAPSVAYIYPFLWLFMVNLNFRDKLAEDYFIKDFQRHADIIYFMIIIMVLLNYTTFMASIALYPVTILVPFYYQLQVQAEVYINPYTGKFLSETE